MVETTATAVFMEPEPYILLTVGGDQQGISVLSIRGVKLSVQEARDVLDVLARLLDELEPH